jgi:hypothetical protein
MINQRKAAWFEHKKLDGHSTKNSKARTISEITIAIMDRIFFEIKTVLRILHILEQ